MDERNLYQILENREVYTFFNNLELQLQRVPGSTGAEIHKRETLRAICHSGQNLYSKGYLPEGQTFSEYCKQDPESYSRIAKRIIDGVNRWGLKI